MATGIIPRYDSTVKLTDREIIALEHANQLHVKRIVEHANDPWRTGYRIPSAYTADATYYRNAPDCWTQYELEAAPCKRI